MTMTQSWMERGKNEIQLLPNSTGEEETEEKEVKEQALTIAPLLRTWLLMIS
jgi:hypothetical protein